MADRTRWLDQRVGADVSPLRVPGRVSALGCVLAGPAGAALWRRRTCAPCSGCSRVAGPLAATDAPRIGPGGGLRRTNRDPITSNSPATPIVDLRATTVGLPARTMAITVDGATPRSRKTRDASSRGCLDTQM